MKTQVVAVVADYVQIPSGSVWKGGEVEITVEEEEQLPQMKEVLVKRKEENGKMVQKFKKTGYKVKK